MFPTAIRCSVLFLLSLSLPLVTCAQLQANKNAIANSLPTKGSVSGTVNAPGLTNPAGLKVTLLGTDSSPAPAPSQVTGPDGSFVFYDIRPGAYWIEIDPSTLPQKYRVAAADTINVQPGTRTEAPIKLEPRRSLVGRTFIDVNGDGVYSPGKDTIVESAQVSVDGKFAVSGSDGSFRFDELPAGRMSLVVCWPGKDQTTHVILDLGEGPVTDRVVNVPLFH